MIILTAKYTVRPGDVQAVIADLTEMTGLVRDNEPGCHMYQVHQSLENSDQLLIFEAYIDQETLDAHMASPYFQTIILGRIVPRLISRERSLWEPILVNPTRG
ncbi:MAG: antibiotic biosynthesis monooxygenase [Sulfobacillus acidophilus]|uniref:Antibiotic biosynthesis monooxygenase n=1 Tax=Sulfobacillus acidophilus TaxID=53633 RepID=A0A2T2WP01_9FIRM|nr:MAG: antibiotic biosynthesis monooxygenase [Sulfobacillus acidophilus]